MKNNNMTPRETLNNVSEITIPVNDLFGATYIDSEGNVYPMYSPDEIEAQQKYPNFALSFGLFVQLWKDIPEPRRGKLFDKMEALVKNLKVMDKLNDWRACPQIAKKWYLGELDSEHYKDENDEKFYEWIISHVEV